MSSPEGASYPGDYYNRDDLTACCLVGGSSTGLGDPIFWSFWVAELWSELASSWGEFNTTLKVSCGVSEQSLAGLRVEYGLSHARFGCGGYLSKFVISWFSYFTEWDVGLAFDLYASCCSCEVSNSLSYLMCLRELWWCRVHWDDFKIDGGGRMLDWA